MHVPIGLPLLIVAFWFADHQIQKQRIRRDEKALQVARDGQASALVELSMARILLRRVCEETGGKKGVVSFWIMKGVAEFLARRPG